MTAEHAAHNPPRGSLNRLAFSATVHCVTGCSIGEVLGMVIGTELSWSNWATVAMSVVLAFGFGYSMTLVPLLRAGLPVSTALGLALVADTLSITVMEIIDNAIMLIIPGAMEAGLTRALFWGSLICSLLVAAIFVYPINRWLIGRGWGHAMVAAHHEGHQA